MAWKNPRGHGGGGGGGTDVIQDKRDYSWLKRVYGQICWASGLGATSTWGEIQIPLPGVAEDNRYGTPAYLSPKQSIRAASGGGSTFTDSEDIFEPELDDNGKPVYDPVTGEQKGKITKRNLSYPDPKFTSANNRAKASGSAYEDEAPGIYDRDELYAPAAHVVSISTSATRADDGMVKEEGTVTVKSYNGMHVGLPSLYSGMGMDWGYCDFSGKITRRCAFGGKVNGGSVTLDSDGGYTVSVSGTSIGQRHPGDAANPFNSDGIVVTVEDPVAGKLTGNGVFGRAGFYDSQGLSGTRPTGPGKVAEVPQNFGTIPVKDGPKAKGQYYRYYESFAAIVDSINTLLAKQMPGTQVKDSGDWDKARAKSIDICAFPLKGLYGGGMSRLSGQVNTAQFAEGNCKYDTTPGASIYDMYFNGDWLSENFIRFNSLRSINASGAGSRGINITGFLNFLINSANQWCGNCFGNLQCGSSADPTDRNIWLWDPDYSPGGPGGGGFGFCRTANLSIKTNSDLDAFRVVTSGTPTGGKAGTINAISGAGTSGKVDVGGQGPAEAAVAANPIQSSCASLAQALATSTDKGMAALPATLSVTTDGQCASLRPMVFSGGGGQVPAGGFTPPSGKGVGFILESVEHSVSGGDWTTTFVSTGVIR